jgi:lipoyl(octanoyl) transferase
VEVHETNRGGEVTYHGPAQIVGYPILDLAPDRKDVRRYVRSVEEGMIRALAMFGVSAGRIPRWPGVWMGSEAAGDARKIGAVGVHIARWITTHGFALNVGVALQDFELIVPCGIREAGVTSLDRELGQEVALSPVEEALARAYADVWEAELQWNEERMRTVSVTAVRRTPRGQEVLLLRRTAERGGFWQPVTGRRLEGERADMAARRELEEETGQSLPSGRCATGTASRSEMPPAPGPRGGLRRRLAGRRARPHRAEHDAAEWVPVEEALQRVRHPGLRRRPAVP